MADVFISYARADKARVAPLVKAIEAKGWSVWWDPEIAPGREFDDEIDTELMSAKAVLVVWTPTSVTSRWVRGEARDAADRNVLVPVRFEQARLPIDVRAIHTTDLDDWRGDPGSAPVQACLQALAAMIERSTRAQAAEHNGARPASGKGPHYSVCVLPFANMSGDPEQEYFSDGITEDIITDLSKVSALEVASRNSSFAYKGKQANVRQVAGELKVSHVLEGSIRRAGGRVRVSAQLTDAASDRQVWGERYDRDSSDIFALQDEISHAIVKALRLQLLPQERRAIRKRGTDNAHAHDLYLMARQMYVSNQMDERASRTIVRACSKATRLDPDYAQAWALMAAGYRNLHELGLESIDGMEAAERALALDPELVEAHAVKGYILQMRGSMDEAEAEVAIALRLDPDSYEANRTAGRLNYQLHRYEEAVRRLGKAASLMDSDANSLIIQTSAYKALGDVANTRLTAEAASKRVDAVLAVDRNNVGAMAVGALALATLGQGEQARARMERALLIEPDNVDMRYNFACALAGDLLDKDSALEMLEPLFAGITAYLLRYLKMDRDFETLHDDPRYQAMVAAAEARLAMIPESAVTLAAGG
ncbi:MAG TPA: TIR domain-containing protein [Rhodanobacteraceae bacterium]|nr:TIR domain-containing protein [Rhodanobacteraceae bacterium]